jgi:hemolysin activation/secretion protein
LALAIVGAALGAAGVPCADAQQVAPSRVTPQTLQPAPQPTPPIALTAPAGLTPPKNAERLSVRVGRFEIAGTFPGFEGRTAALFDPLRGKRVTVAWVYATANALEHAYAEAGYFLARVVIPPQQLVDGGPLHLTVVDGVIERVEVKDVPKRQRAVVMARLAGLVGLHHLTLDEIERRLLLVSDLPGLHVRSTLAAGNTPGGTLLVLQGTQSYAAGTFGFDDRLPASLGTWSLNASAALNGALGLGEQTYFSIDSTPDIGLPRLRVLGGGIVLPIGGDGFTVNPEYTKSLARPIPPAGTPATQGDFQRLAVRANYPLIRTRAENLTLQGSLEWDDETLIPIGFATKFYHDDYQAARLRAIYSLAPQPDIPVQLTGSLSHGLAGRIATGALPLSRLGASPNFTSAAIEASLQYPLPASLVLAVTGRAQTSFDSPLMLSEQFALDGLAALSAFADGTFSVDQGATLRAELRRPLVLPVAGQSVILTPYLFGAGGWGEFIMPTAVEHRDLGAGAAGFGLRTDAGIAGVAGGTLAVEFARKFSDVTAVPAGYRANLSLILRF